MFRGQFLERLWVGLRMPANLTRLQTARKNGKDLKVFTNPLANVQDLGGCVVLSGHEIC